MKLHFYAVPVLAFLLPLSARAQQLDVQLAKGSPVFAVGERVVWNLRLSGEGADAVKELRYVLKRDHQTVLAEGTLPLLGGAAKLDGQLDAPGTLLAQISFAKANGETTKIAAAAVVEPSKIQPTQPEPEDFQAFWKSKIQELAQVPQNPVLSPEASRVEGIGYWKFTLDNIGGTKVRGQLARPEAGIEAGEKLPAVVRFQYAGVYGLPKSNVTDRAKAGWLALNISAHDLPLDQPAAFYEEQAQGALKNYVAIGAESREASYFKRMILGCYRTIEYLKTRPDWDGKTLVVEGTSQGGLQSLAMGGLSPDVTAVLVNVPAGCDVGGAMRGRATPWPYWPSFARDKPQVLETSRYFDALNFARHIKVPTLVGVGMLDMTATTPGVIAAFNQVQVLAPLKQLVIMERSDHRGTGGTQGAFTKASRQWLGALVKGRPIPEPQPADGNP